MISNSLRATILMGLVWAHGLSWGQAGMHDPTMPPPGSGSPVPQAIGVAETGAPPAVQIRKLAPIRKDGLIGDSQFKTGDQLGAWRVVRITADGVVLQTGGNSRSIPALPVVKKKMISDAAPALSTKNAKP